MSWIRDTAEEARGCPPSRRSTVDVNLFRTLNELAVQHGRTRQGELVELVHVDRSRHRSGIVRSNTGTLGA